VANLGKRCHTTGCAHHVLRRIEELSIKVSIQCDSTIVSPVDFIVADLMCVTVIPLASAEGVVEKAREQGVREVATRE
jgi:4-hydroxy-4-methyl-2-oxoglutarate aldolase|tara:strand:+ start:457 stop:690 length:234 start_codon:yes stop_codon:yes gene_type:complete